VNDRLGNDVPEHALRFAQYLSAHGWNYLREYIHAWEDEEGWHEGFWSQDMWHEKPAAWPREEGIWFFSMSADDHMIAHEAAWPRFLEFANECSERDRISCRLPFMYEPPPGFLDSVGSAS
jgi:hypothetical protein